MVSILFTVGFVFVGWIAGLILYHAGSVFAGIVLPPRYASGIARYHFKESVRALKRFLIHIRNRKDVALLPSKPNTSERGGERITYHGEKLDFEDASDLMTYCFNRPCGIAVEGAQALIDPIVAEVGAKKRELRDANRFARDLEPHADDLNIEEQVYGYTALPAHFPVPRTIVGSRMSDAFEVLTGGTPPTAVDSSRNLIEKAFQAMNSTNEKQLFVLAMLFGAGAGAVVVMDMLVNGGGSTGGGQAPPPGGSNVTNAILLVWWGVRR